MGNSSPRCSSRVESKTEYTHTKGPSGESQSKWRAMWYYVVYACDGTGTNGGLFATEAAANEALRVYFKNNPCERCGRAE
jgi:hypothetical protein